VRSVLGAGAALTTWTSRSVKTERRVQIVQIEAADVLPSFVSFAI